jgi:aryl-alcohol dehydrogenase-like predicted oxidoreductase
MSTSRRDFLKVAAVAGAGSVAGSKAAAAQASGGGTMSVSQVPKRELGKTGMQVSALGVGGYHLGSTRDQKEATELVARALDAGINFFDNAWEYHKGESELRLGVALRGKRDQAIVMSKVCTHGRDKAVGLRMLEESLRRLQTDHLDVWQVHEVVYEDDPELIFRPNGVAEALIEAKKQGKVRAIGFTGHKDPSIHLRMLEHDFPFDTMQMPLNCFDATFRSFEQSVLPEARRRGIAVLGMKSLGGSGEMVKKGGVTPEEGLRYAMSLPVATTISGMDSIDVLEQNLKIVAGFQPYTAEEMDALRKRSQELAADGRMELFKTTKMYDGDEGRQQHHFPSAAELPV